MRSNSHLMELPQKILIGESVLYELGQFIKDSGVEKNVVIASGPNVQRKVRQTIASSLGDSATWVDVTSSDMKSVTSVVRATARASAIVGLGGGKSVDVGKLAAFRRGLPFFSVPTSASHDGIASPFASIHGTRRHYSYPTKPPVGILADVEVIAAAPRRLLAAGCGDLVSKLTAVKDWQLAQRVKGEYYGAYAANLAIMSAKVVLDGSKKIGLYTKAAVREQVEALISAGVAAGIAGSSRPCSGAEHLFSHSLDAIAPGVGLHGEKCGIGAILIAKLQGLDWRHVKQALKDVHAPTSASEVGLPQDKVVEALVSAASIRPDRYTILTKVKMTPETARALAIDTGVI